VRTAAASASVRVVQHPLHGGLGSDERGADVQVQQCVEGRRFGFDERLRDVGPGIVDQDVEGGEGGERLPHRRLVQHIQDKRAGATATPCSTSPPGSPG